VEAFTPIAATLGGILIGLASLVVLAALGRITGVSGIVGGLLREGPASQPWRAAFVAGLFGAGVVLAEFMPQAFESTIDRSPAALIVAGLLVGFGTRLGSGCTSGHGVCGISRFSRRSITATLAFIASGAATATVVTQVFGGSL
jgi:uncharacterized membrane protein YedE/YeeE